MPKAFINGAHIYYLQLGSGPDVVLAHGLAANHAFWYLQIARALQDHFRVTLYDLRGHGHSEATESGYTSAEMAADLLGLLDHLEIPRAHMVGHSFGGVVSLHCALLNPDRAVTLTLADSRIRALQPFQRLWDSPYWSTLEESFLQQSDVNWEDETEVGLRLLEEFAKRPDLIGSQALRRGFVPFNRSFGKVKAAQQWLRLLSETTAADDVRSVAGLTIEKIRTLDTPTLLIYGEHSRCLESSRALQAIIPSCKSVIVPGVGHFHPLTASGVFVQSLWAFLADPKPVPDGTPNPFLRHGMRASGPFQPQRHRA